MKKLLLLLFSTVGIVSALVAQDIEVTDAKFKTTKNANGKTENKRVGAVNWTGQYIEATGESFFNTEKFKIPGQAGAMAREGAKAIAYSNLHEIIDSLRTPSIPILLNLFKSPLISNKYAILLKHADTIRGIEVISSKEQTNSILVTVRWRFGLAGSSGEVASNKEKMNLDPLCLESIVYRNGSRIRFSKMVTPIEAGVVAWEITNQIWMSKNLNADTFRNGERISEAKTPRDWKKACKKGLPAWCYYNNDPAYGIVYGKIYNYWAFLKFYENLLPKGYYVCGFLQIVGDSLIPKKKIGFYSTDNQDSPATVYFYSDSLKIKLDFSDNALIYSIKDENAFLALSSLMSNDRYDFKGGYRDEKGNFEGLKTNICWWSLDKADNGVQVNVNALYANVVRVKKGKFVLDAEKIDLKKVENIGCYIPLFKKL